MNNKSGFTSWISPSNIALVKYWGKKENQIPINPSISFTLKNCNSKTKVTYSQSNKGFNYEFFFHGEKKKSFNKKIDTFFKRIIQYCPSLNQLSLKIESENTFPHSSGIASSASAFSSLSLCIYEIEKMINENEKDFFNQSSIISRLGSGSASRSIYGPIAVWGKTKHFENSSDDYAIPVKNYHKIFNNYMDTILIVDHEKKDVSSSHGHELMNTHIFKVDRVNKAHENIGDLKKSLISGDLESFIHIVEQEALMLHALMMTSKTPYILFKPNTIQIINEVWSFRKETNLNLCFTLDAGANVHLLYPKNEEIEIKAFIEKNLSKFCNNKKYIHDLIGDGPKPRNE